MDEEVEVALRAEICLVCNNHRTNLCRGCGRCPDCGHRWKCPETER